MEINLSSPQTYWILYTIISLLAVVGVVWAATKAARLEDNGKCPGGYIGIAVVSGITFLATGIMALSMAWELFTVALNAG